MSDIFLSADDVYPSKLSSLGFADAQTQLTYALGQLVLYGAGDVEQNLKSGNFLKLALANFTRLGEGVSPSTPKAEQSSNLLAPAFSAFRIDW